MAEVASDLTRVRRSASVLRLVRVRDWLHFLVLPAVALQPNTSDWSRLALAVVVAAGCLAVAYGYNVYADAGLARRPTASVRDTYRFSAPQLRALLLAVAGASLLLAATLSGIALLAAALSLGAGYAYSGGPRLKRWPGVGSVTNLAIFVPLLALALGPTLRREMLELGLAFAGLLLQSQLLHELAHRREDAAEGVITTSVHVGPEAAKRLAFAAALLPIAVFARMGWRRMDLGIALAALALFTFAILHLARARTGDDDDLNTWRLAHRHLGLLVGGWVWLSTLLGP